MPILAPAGALPPPPIPLGPQWYHTRIVWEGWDGSEWELTNPRSPAFITDGGMRGFGRPQFTRYKTEAPAVAGSRYRGFRTSEREVFLPLYMWSDSGSTDFLNWDEQFQATMHPDRPGTLTVAAADGRSTRSLRCRFSDDESDGLDRDPAFRGWCPFGVRLIAEAPYWQGPPLSYTFQQADLKPFYSSPGALPFAVQISRGSTIETASVRNDGDVDGFLRHAVHGPTTSVTIKGTEFPFAIADGKAVILDTNPASGWVAWQYDVTVDDAGQFVYSNTGVDRSKDLGAVDFSPVETGQSVAVPMTMVGNGLVVTTITPNYFRAVG